MPILKLDNVTLSYTSQPLLDKADLMIEKGDRICLIGRNGTGKSSLLKVINHEIEPDSGTIWKDLGIKITKLNQDLPENLQCSVFDYIKTAFSAEELTNDWQFNHQINKYITKFKLNATEQLANLSGGSKRRAALAKALVIEPDILLLDEPTNHLDINAIQDIENLISKYQGAVICISHDRSLVNKVANTIIELDRGKLYRYPGNYQKFLQLKAKRLEIEEENNAKFDKKLSQEEKWIRQGIKARRTRNEGRVRALQQLRKQRAARAEIIKNPSFSINQANSSGKLVLEAENINFKNIIHDFSCTVLKQDKIGIIGPNGCGKSTLIKLLLQQITPGSGKVKHGTELNVAYFDQLRDQLDLNLSVIDNVAEGRSKIDINGQQQHIIGYLGNFLFTPERCLTPMRNLSGGESNRLLLAKLFSKPSNLLVLDEPTNDLDIESLELLEELLIDYQGTIFLVSHDRTFLDNVVSSVIVFADTGEIQEYIGGYRNWETKDKTKDNNQDKYKNKTTKKYETKSNKIKKLSYNQQRELNNLPEKIHQLEQSIHQLQTTMATNDFFKKDSEEIKQHNLNLQQLQNELKILYQRWEELENFL